MYHWAVSHLSLSCISVNIMIPYVHGVFVLFLLFLICVVFLFFCLLFVYLFFVLFCFLGGGGGLFCFVIYQAYGIDDLAGVYRDFQLRQHCYIHGFRTSMYYWFIWKRHLNLPNLMCQIALVSFIPQFIQPPSMSLAQWCQDKMAVFGRNFQVNEKGFNRISLGFLSLSPNNNKSVNVTKISDVIWRH